MTVKQSFEVPHEGSELVRAARRKIDDDIGELERRTRSLRTKRNELSPVSVLPPEVLSKIFILVRDSSMNIQIGNRQAPWIHVGQVCHHWQEVSLRCPSLWSVPVFTRPYLAQEMIRRSKMAALTIRSSPVASTPRMLEQLENTLAQIPRIQSLELRLEGHMTIFSSLSKPAPLLENLSLSGPVYSTQLHFPSDVLSDAPRLRSIELRCLNFSWESAVFKHRNLTALRLNDNRIIASTIGQMMDALHHLPNLRTLNLSNSIPPHTTSNGNEKILEFKFLEQLELGDRAADCIFLLHHLQYPPHVTVGLYSSSTSVEDGSTTFSLLSQKLRGTQSIKVGIPHSPVDIQSARLTTDEPDVVDIAFFNKFDMKSLHMPFGGPDPILRIYLRGDFTDILTQARTRLFTSVCNCFDLSWTGVSPTTTCAQFGTPLGSCRNLRLPVYLRDAP